MEDREGGPRTPAGSRRTIPLIHSPLGERNGTPSSSSFFKAKVKTGLAYDKYSNSASASSTATRYHSLWREAEDRAAALSEQLKMLRDKDKETREDVEMQRKLLRKAASEVKVEVVSMQQALKDKENELEAARKEAEEARTNQGNLESDIKRYEDRVEDLASALRGEKERVKDLAVFEEEVKVLETQSAKLYSEKVVTLEQSLEDLSRKLNDLSAAELEEPYPQEMKSNHIWQQATNAAKARSRGQRAAAFAGQAKAEARVSALQRELDSQIRRNLGLEKEVRVARLRSSSTEEKLEEEGKNLLTLSQELEGMSKKFQETEAKCTDTSESFNAFVGKTKELAGSLLSEIEPIEAEEDYEISSANDSEGEDGGEEDGQYNAAFSFLASAVRKYKAAMKYTKASSRAQLQAREVALNEVREEREIHRKQIKDLKTGASDLERLNEQLEEKVDDLEALLAATTSAKEKSIASAQQDLETSRKDATDLMERTEMLEDENQSLVTKIRSLEEKLSGERASMETSRKDATDLTERTEMLEDENQSLVTKIRSLEEKLSGERASMETSRKDATDLMERTEMLEDENQSLVTKIRSLEEKLSGERASMETSRKDATDLMERTIMLEDENQSLVTKIRSLEEKLSGERASMETSRKDATDLMERTIMLEDENQSLVTKIRSLEEKLSGERASMETSRKDATDLMERTEMLEDENQSLVTKIRSLEEKLSGERASMETSRKDATDLMERTEMLEDENQSLVTKIRSLEEKLSGERASIAKLQSSTFSEQKTIALLQQERDESAQKLEDITQSYEIERSDLENRNEELETQKAKLEEVVSSQSSEIKAAEALSISLRREFENHVRGSGKKMQLAEESLARYKVSLEASQEEAKNLRSSNERLNRSVEGIKTRLEGSILEGSDREKHRQSLRDLSDALKSQIKNLEEELASKDFELQDSRAAQADLESKVKSSAAKIEEGKAKIQELSNEMSQLRERAGGTSTERDELMGDIAHLEASVRSTKESLASEQQASSKQSIEIEKLKAHISALEIEVEKYIELLTRSNSDKATYEEKFGDLKEHLSEVEDEKETYNEQIGILKESLDHKNEQIKLYGISCRDILVQIKESISLAFGDQFPGVVSGVHLDATDGEAGGFDFDAEAYISMKKLCGEVFPILKSRMDDDKESMKQMRQGVENLKRDLGQLMARETELKNKLAKLQDESFRCKEERDNSVGSTEILQAQIAELKRVLEETAMKSTESETELQRKNAELAHLNEDLEMARSHRKEVNKVVNMFQEAERHFSRHFLEMEKQLGKIKTGAEKFENVTRNVRQKSELRSMVDEIRHLQDLCTHQRNLIARYGSLSEEFGMMDEHHSEVYGEIVQLQQELRSCSEAFQEGSAGRMVKSSSNVGRKNRPWWQTVLTLPIRLLPAVAMIASSRKSKELREKAVQLFLKGGHSTAGAQSPVVEKKPLGAKPYLNGSPSKFDFSVPRNRVLMPNKEEEE
ncbi:hypothetical protein HOP50_10g60020 [Chloropicon primus]|nr:hypothetical protein HOP50_10g60020 [Chloropicon primus]